MIPVEEALKALFDLVAPLETEDVPLLEAHGRVLRADILANRDQPPFAASAMDGYAVADASVGQTLRVIGESSAGHGFAGTVATGEAVRIFTGAPMPEGAQRVVIQEDVTADGNRITVGDLSGTTHVRPAGADFLAGFRVAAPRKIRPADVALFAAMNAGSVRVSRRPRVALIATGDELVSPGEVPGRDQIVASNTYGLHAMLRDVGAEPRMLPIARDTHRSLDTVLGLVDDADLVITVGGASVGDHDLVVDAAGARGMERSFYKIAMRPGKPLMAGCLGVAVMIGLPGNPVSALVCGHVFVLPVVRAMLGLPAEPARRASAVLTHDLPENGMREHYMRAFRDAQGITVFERQDSALLSVLNEADALAIRPANDPPRSKGESIEYIPL
ncbi:molybdopterin biosynthesis protein MoeA [Roseivivax halodurans JCM 10272]|uniref:Molybdopterin molybdenumtransferase n=1 Tax=Roseivivax halodurans JCM 10272 TaxID=1449350 RepID=X7EHH0_9RHOB|nr:molybdopterin molybdotransferase MoeA [Roseivivax halodurans]ETX14651.1 molybdopterin biosynthesis protein MoeA [Roseivivax halodurans JCM 10272]